MFDKIFFIVITKYLLITQLSSKNCVWGNSNEANGKPNQTIGIQNPTPESLQSVTRYSFPQFREVSPCSCDVTLNKCDIGCCCDAECPKENNNNITCIPGKYIINLQN